MQLLKIKEKIKQSYHKFSDGTSMHGFTELYYAKTIFWKIVWFVVIVGATCITIYQVMQAINNYVYQPSNTVIQPATFDQVKYPPLKYCVAHWLHWIDWDKLLIKGFSKGTILFGMSYLTDIYSKQHFNVTESAENFTLLLKENNITNMMDFYKTFAKPFLYNFGSPNIFTKTEFVVTDLGNPYFCSTTSGDEIKSYLNKTENNFGNGGLETQKNTIILTSNSKVKPEVNYQEYNSYMAQWILAKTEQYYLTETGDYADVHNNYSLVVPPNILFVDGYSSVNIKMLHQIDEYFITVKASSRRWKNSYTNKCVENVVSVLSDTSCSPRCYLLSNECYYKTNDYDFVSSTLLNSTSEPAKLIKYEIRFLNAKQSTTWSANLEQTLPSALSTTYNENPPFVTIEESNVLSTYWQTELADSENNTFTPTMPRENSYQHIETCNFTLAEIAYNICVTEKCKTLGCELWTFDITVTTRSLYDIVKDVAWKSITTVYIKYPSSDESLIMTETDSKTWEDFVGNVGGLLGIWTGASIISLLQMFYLCCCANMEGGHFSFTKWFKGQNSRSNTGVVANRFKRTNRSRPLKRIKTIIINPYNAVKYENQRDCRNRGKPITLVPQLTNGDDRITINDKF